MIGSESSTAQHTQWKRGAAREDGEDEPESTGQIADEHRESDPCFDGDAEDAEDVEDEEEGVYCSASSCSASSACQHDVALAVVLSLCLFLIMSHYALLIAANES